MGWGEAWWESGVLVRERDLFCWWFLLFGCIVCMALGRDGLRQ